MTALEIVTTDITGTAAATAHPGPTTIVTTSGGASSVLSVATVTAGTTVAINEGGVQGPPGPAGPRGLRGDTGPAGAGHDPVLFTQDMPSTQWDIPHPFPGRPSVTVTDHLGDCISVEISHAPGLVTIRTDRPSSGSAYLI